MEQEDWVKWGGGDWLGDPGTLVHVKIGPLCDDNLPPVPASYWGLAHEVSNWRGTNGMGKIEWYRICHE